MAVAATLNADVKPTGRQALICRMQEIDAKSGVVDDPTMTIGKLREMLRTLDVRPEDNGASRDLMQMRYGDDWEKE